MISLYRKYRSQKVSELDLERVREFFERILSSGQFSHAYLFSGPKGTGKTSSARILAKILNCGKNQQQSSKAAKFSSFREPCGVCESCVGIVNGAGTAVVEIDAASNRGIDDMRALRERVGLVATQGRYRVYIIDEVHMLTKEAFNALLKTLEEPPEHVVFCLCTTEESKLPDTIVSRCTKVAFARASQEELMRSLGRVIEGEKLKISNEALGEIARRSDGSFRDGIKVLEQLSGSDGEITLGMVEKEVGVLGEGVVVGLFEMIVAGSTKKALELVSEFEKQGLDMRLLAKSLLVAARERMLAEVSEGGEASVEMVEFIAVFGKCFSRFSGVPVPALPVEMAIVEFCLKRGDLGGGGSLGGSVGGSGKKSRVVGEELAGRVSKPGPVGRISDNLELGSRRVVTPEPRTKWGEQEGKQGAVQKGNGRNGEVKAELVLAKVQAGWAVFLEQVSKYNHGLEMILRSAKIRACHGCELTVAVGYKFHKQQLEQERYLSQLEKILSSDFGGRVKLTFVLEKGAGELSRQDRAHENVSGVVEESDEDLVKAAEEIFG